MGPRAVHPDIVEQLCTLCPDLLEDLMDGMLWHSSNVEGGKVERASKTESDRQMLLLLRRATEKCQHHRKCSRIMLLYMAE